MNADLILIRCNRCPNEFPQSFATRITGPSKTEGGYSSQLNFIVCPECTKSLNDWHCYLEPELKDTTHYERFKRIHAIVFSMWEMLERGDQEWDRVLHGIATLCEDYYRKLAPKRGD